MNVHGTESSYMDILIIVSWKWSCDSNVYS